MADTQEKQVPYNKGKQLSPSAQQQLPCWVLIWFYVTALICTWDASFIMFRPYSLPGGSLAWIWYAYKYYITVDQRYLDTGDAYVYAQSLLNYAEVVINVVAIVMHYRRSRHTVATAFMVSVMTMWKTVLYFLMFSDLCTGSQYRQGNTVLQEIFLMVIPNFVWIVLPSAAMVVLWGCLVPRTELMEQQPYLSADTLCPKTGDCQWFTQSGKVITEDVLLQEEALAKRLPLSLTSTVQQRSGAIGRSDRK